MEDIPLLIEHFITRFNLLQNKEVTGVTDEVLSCLMSYHYPGNVRELESIIERAFVWCRSGQIELWHMSDFPPCGGAVRMSGLVGFHQFEASFLISVLRRNNWNRLETARQLGMHKTTPFRKIRALGLKIPHRGDRLAS
jgi:DNA-binding NtrC family response regulator